MHVIYKFTLETDPFFSHKHYIDTIRQQQQQVLTTLALLHLDDSFSIVV